MRTGNSSAGRASGKSFRSSLAHAALTLSASLSMIGWGNAALADNFDQALALFKARNYAGAAPLFKKAIFDRPGDPNCFYYWALACQYSKDFKNAQVGYMEVLSRYPSSQAAGLAQQALKTLSPGLLESAVATPRATTGTQVTSYAGSRGGTAGGGAGGDIIPASSYVNFDLVDNHYVIPASFNGRQHKVVFDTGAESILLGKNHLSEMGIPAPTGPTTAYNRDAGGHLEELWGVRMDVTVGGVTRKNILVHVKEKMDSLPLLGLPFVKGMNYQVDHSSIRFSSKSGTATASASMGSSYNAVPYALEGRTMVVRVKVNGKDIAMCLDTGAAATLFTNSQAASVGIRPGDEPETNLGSGVGGAISGRYAQAGSMELGPIRQRDFKVGVSDSITNSKYPLLGKDFWEGHRFSVDEDRHLIHFN